MSREKSVIISDDIRAGDAGVLVAAMCILGVLLCDLLQQGGSARRSPVRRVPAQYHLSGVACGSRRRQEWRWTFRPVSLARRPAIGRAAIDAPTVGPAVTLLAAEIGAGGVRELFWRCPAGVSRVIVRSHAAVGEAQTKAS
jgi:hypothetical protein